MAQTDSAILLGSLRSRFAWLFHVTSLPWLAKYLCVEVYTNLGMIEHLKAVFGEREIRYGVVDHGDGNVILEFIFHFVSVNCDVRVPVRVIQCVTPCERPSYYFRIRDCSDVLVEESWAGINN